MSTRTSFTALVAAVTTSLVLAGCGGGGGEASAEADDTVDVLVLAPLSGPVASLGETAEQAFTAAAKVINDEGGILGRDVKLTFEDDRFDPVTAQNILQEALASDNPPDMVFPGAASGVTVPILPVLTQREILSVGTAASPLANDPEKFPYAFNLLPPPDDYERPMAEFLRENDLTKVAVLVDASESGSIAADALLRQAEESGVEVEIEKIDPAAVDATAELSRLMRNEPQALVLEALTSPATMQVVLESKDKLGWDVQTIFGQTNGITGIQQGKESQIRGNFLQAAAINVMGSERQETEGFKTFQESVDAEAATKNYQLLTYAIDYSTLLVLRAGAEKAGSLEGPKVAEAIESLTTGEDIPGWFLTQNPGFSDDRHQPTWEPEDFQIVELGFPGYDSDSGLFLPEG